MNGDRAEHLERMQLCKRKRKLIRVSRLGDGSANSESRAPGTRHMGYVSVTENKQVLHSEPDVGNGVQSPMYCSLPVQVEHGFLLSCLFSLHLQSFTICTSVY